jgi:hypothetical protein
MKYCKLCILPETYPGITFNEEGVCNYCLEHQPQKPVLGKEKIIQEIAANKSEGPYDCLVPLSGGKDSTYVLYYVVKELGLRPLAVTYNSGYRTQIADENVQNACKALSVPLVEVHSPGKTQTHMLRIGHKLAEKYDAYWGVCENCEPILRIVTINTARRHKIPLVMWGSSLMESIVVKRSDSEKEDLSSLVQQKSWLKSFTRLFQKLIKQPTKILDHLPYYYYNAIQRIRLGFPLKYILNPFAVPPLTRENPRFIPFFDYITWDSIAHISLLESELGWKHPEGIESRFDCSLHCVGNLARLDTWGISADGINLCNFIRDGKLTREEALARESKIVSVLDEEYEDLLHRIGS